MDLNKNWEGFNIENCHLYFEDNPNYRAASDPRGQVKLISISNSMINALFNRPAAFAKRMAEVPLLKPFFGDNVFKQPGVYLMGHFGFLFLYYHELAHIIQNIDCREMTGQVHGNLSAAETLEAHLLEWDADQFSSSFICRHIIKRWEGGPDELRTVENLEAFVGIALATHFMMMDTFHFGIGPVYFLEKSHPHPIIRINGMTAKILEVMVYHYGFNLNVENIRKVFMAIVEATELKGSHIKFEEGMLNNYPGFAEYGDKIVRESGKLEYLALRKFGKVVASKLRDQR